MLPFLIRGEKKLQPSRLRLPKILANPPFSLFKRNLRSPPKSSAPPSTPLRYTIGSRFVSSDISCIRNKTFKSFVRVKTLTSQKSFRKVWLQFNGNFCIIHRFRVITYGNKIQNTLCNNPGKLNRKKGRDRLVNTASATAKTC